MYYSAFGFYYNIFLKIIFFLQTKIKIYTKIKIIYCEYNFFLKQKPLVNFYFKNKMQPYLPGS